MFLPALPISSKQEKHHAPSITTPLRCPLSTAPRQLNASKQTNTVQWLERQTTKLLPTTYFMVTFTLPATLRHLAHMQTKSLVLHTHNRQRDMHPHLHAIVPAGFYHPTRKQWHKGNKQYLYPHARQRYHRHQ